MGSVRMCLQNGSVFFAIRRIPKFGWVSKRPAKIWVRE